jgi:hypothetical protein
MNKLKSISTQNELRSNIDLIDYILNSLCMRELNADGRKLINKLRAQFQTKLDELTGT